MSQRYIPPGARRGHSVHADKTEQRSLSEVAASLEAETYVVKLKSKWVFSDIPAPVVENDSQGTTGGQQFQLTFDQGKLKEIFKWFRGIGRKDTDAVLEFPPSLNKGRRQQIHQLAQTFGLGTSSKGFGDQRFISVYSIEKNVLGVGKMCLTRDEQEQAEELWRLIKEARNPKFFNFSLNEIREMILADQLDPALQELWDSKHSLALADDLSRKCRVEDTK